MNFTWLQENALVLGFYLLIGLLIYIYRKRFEFQGIVLLLKTKLGIKSMKRFATPLPEKKDFFGRRLFVVSTFVLIASVVLFFFQLFFGAISLDFFFATRLLLFVSFLGLCVSIVFFRQIKLAGTMGVYVGFFGMFLMVALIVFSAYLLFFVPSAPPMFAPVLPGISIPGVDFKLPLFEGLIALLIVVAIHEFSHGVVSKAYKIPIKSSGFVMFGPLPGAFVEPDEKKLAKSSKKTQLSVYGAGPFSNMLLAFFILFIIILLTSSLYAYEPYATSVTGFSQADGLDERGVSSFQKGEIILGVNNQSLREIDEGILERYNESFGSLDGVRILVYAINNFEPGDEVIIQTNKANRSIILGASPRNESVPIIGVHLDTAVIGKTRLSENDAFNSVYFWLVGNQFSRDINQNLGLFYLVFVLSFGIGIFNLLPAGPLDGGRMFYVFFKDKIGERTTSRLLSILSWTFFVTIIILVFVPIIRAVI